MNFIYVIISARNGEKDFSDLKLDILLECIHNKCQESLYMYKGCKPLYTAIWQKALHFLKDKWIVCYKANACHALSMCYICPTTAHPKSVFRNCSLTAVIIDVIYTCKN